MSSKIVLIKGLVQTKHNYNNNCPYNIKLREKYFNDDQLDDETSYNEEICDCETKSEDIKFTVTLPNELKSYEVGQEIKNYNWNYKIKLNTRDILIVYDEENLNELEPLKNRIVIQSAIVTDSTEKIIYNNIIDIIAEENEKETKRNNRLTDLKKSLNKRGVEFRTDSHLCNQYINGSDRYTIEHITNVICQMKYLYEYCDYKKFIEKAKIKGSYDREVIKKQALDTKSKGVYPSVFPWEKNKDEDDETYASFIRCSIM